MHPTGLLGHWGTPLARGCPVVHQDTQASSAELLSSGSVPSIPCRNIHVQNEKHVTSNTHQPHSQKIIIIIMLKKSSPPPSPIRSITLCHISKIMYCKEKFFITLNWCSDQLQKAKSVTHSHLLPSAMLAACYRLSSFPKHVLAPVWDTWEPLAAQGAPQLLGTPVLLVEVVQRGALLDISKL